MLPSPSMSATAGDDELRSLVASGQPATWGGFVLTERSGPEALSSSVLSRATMRYV
jgi:hypothetical protein